MVKHSLGNNLGVVSANLSRGCLAANWQTSHPGDRTIRLELRRILRDSGLPYQGDLFDHAYDYIRENY